MLCDVNSDCAIISGNPVCICRSGYEQDTNDPTVCNGECLVCSIKVLTFRNEFNFWKAHGIMNTSGLLQSK